ncbi:aldehyde reductase [Plectosphaerella plurivora]|uniref:Aldehyde reductase n=1 Tax=Plectosphaerella plurivora TaxID=936078 RepID=A0A9P8VHC1_9PEZI|nr:aldehyde reductase [Plectosphaerella plurivora]
MSSPKTTIPVGSLILVTGATGFIATHVIAKFLSRGYKVRGTVRNLEQASWLVNDRFKASAETGDLHLITVPDLAAEHAFDDAVKGVSAIVHIASILTFDSNPHTVIPQAVAGVTSVLAAALKEPSVKEIVFTSSLVAATRAIVDHETTIDQNSWNEEDVKAAWAPPPYEPSRAMYVYAASKVAAEKALWQFVEEKKPHYTVNAVGPSGVIGEPLHEKHADNPANWLAALFKKQKALLDQYFGFYFVDVHDVAALHIAAVLDPEVKNARLQTWGHNANWNDFLPVLRELCPQRDFLPDWPEDFPLTHSPSTDQSESVALLRKWFNQDGWKPLKDSITEAVESPFFKL